VSPRVEKLLNRKSGPIRRITMPMTPHTPMRYFFHSGILCPVSLLK
jgi:hypothetical protein